MFFSTELLSKRDNGFGLLWLVKEALLAATLGSKSSFKKLPRRSIQTADIPQLCDLISHPSEPLALRLSSNLMVGVASSRLVHNPDTSPDALTLTADPAVAIAFEFDAFDANWADLSTFSTQRQRDAEEDDEFTLEGQRSKAKPKGKSKTSLIPSETARANLHTLDESHELLLSTSFEANGSFLAGFDPSSSQVDPAMRFGSFAFDDNLFGAGDHFDLGLGDIGDELARELGEGWGADAPNVSFDVPMQNDGQDGFDMFLDPDGYNPNEQVAAKDAKSKSVQGRKRPFVESDKENLPPALNNDQAPTPRSILTHLSQASAPRSFAEELIAIDNLAEFPKAVEGHPTTGDHATRKKKKVRILLDGRIELTDEELKAARADYVNDQRAIRRDMERKKFEKDGTKALEDLIWGIPEGCEKFFLPCWFCSLIPTLQLLLQLLSTFGLKSSNYKWNLDPEIFIQLTLAYERPTKRRKKASITEGPHNQQDIFDGAGYFGGDDYQPMDFGMGSYMPPLSCVNLPISRALDVDFNAPVNFGDATRLRSSEEPERGRDAAAPTSHFGLDVEALNPSSGTQRTAFFPWDNAAGTSSSAGAGFVPVGDKGSDRLSLDKVDVRIQRSRSRSGSREASFSAARSQNGSLAGLNFRMSPSGQHGSGFGDDFQFDVTNDRVPAQDTQEAENVVTIERTSYNFLEYCKMQAQVLPSGQTSLAFSDVVPSTTSSRRVAAAAFHHCLGTFSASDSLTYASGALRSPPLSVL
ncbi:uncharacterized protein FOMMEDRAFT_155258 [Fomitiporia mediterranea MF3/22]|uniref:uncharacterized protein n=1 Tax=Fomitiporia mediterranea (strain MF3/22) TaxID=694068 RepID=UPI000440853E|nr:uncharacterized protein FOMMEDRAFT_155258 [Fomitiporia mediterranea MF3/22]EJD04134.1 hypothetical protein FOMMEDRAFT_155258 [Fomitiporia mediterranea MF3/22]